MLNLGRFIGPYCFHQIAGNNVLLSVQVVMCENVKCDWPFKDINGSIILGKVVDSL